MARGPYARPQRGVDALQVDARDDVCQELLQRTVQRRRTETQHESRARHGGSAVLEGQRACLVHAGGLHDRAHLKGGSGVLGDEWGVVGGK